MIGEIINDKYKIESVFNESHMYELFTAIEISTGSTVVLKLMKEEMAINAERVKNFSDEIKNFAGLSHPLIAEILDLDMYEDRPYVVSPLIDGISLKQVISNEVLSLPDSVKVIQDMAAVLQCAADKKIENRNINLSNVLRKKDGHITVLSFTLPRLKLVSSVSVKRSENSGVQSDLYFLGTALFELLAGESPIRNRGGLYDLWAMKLQKALRIRHPELEPEQQDKIIDFITKTLTRDMGNRFNSYEDFLKGLADLAGTLRSANIKSRFSRRQLSMASQVVDALNGKISCNTLEAPSNETLSVSASNSNLIGDKVSAEKTQKGYAEVSTEGNLALVVDNDNLEDNETDEVKVVSKSPKPATKLRLVKNTKTAKIKSRKSNESNEWAEDRSLFKSPVFLIGVLLSVMVMLILFW